MSQHESFAGRQFYHGTTMSNADGILHEGEKMFPGVMGKGFYITDSPALAGRYAEYASGRRLREGGTAVILRGEVHPEAPADHDDFSPVTNREDLSMYNGIGVVRRPGVFHPTHISGDKPGTWVPLR